MALEQDLKSIGLEEKEARVYLAALELGSANIQELTKKSNIKRSTVYEMLKNLKELGLISETTKGKRKLFLAAEPEKLKRSIKAKEQLLNEMLPELKSLSNLGSVKPKITYYEGREGLREIWRDALKIKSKMTYWIAPIQDVVETVGEDFLNKYIEERTKKGIWIKTIHITSKIFPDYKYIDPTTYEKTLRQVRFTPAEMNIQNTIAIYDNKVAIINSRKEGFGFIMESNDYAETMKVFHDLLWNISKPWREMNFGKKDALKESEKENDKEDDYWK